MFHVFVLFCLWRLFGVFSKSLSAMEGESVTLHTDVTEIHEDDDILWKFGVQKTLIAEISREKLIFDGPDGRFRDRLKLDNQTGSLTITNISTEHTGDYQLQMNRAKLSSRTFSVLVYARLPVPVIIRDCSSSSSSSHQYCSLLCSVVNVSHVTLSWYKGNSSLSSTSVSDLNRSISLDVDHRDENTYFCVVKNSISNQTRHLDISQICRSCPDEGLSSLYMLAISLAAAAAALFPVVALVIYCISKTSRQKAESWKEDRSVSAVCKPATRNTKSKLEAVYENVPKKR